MCYFFSGTVTTPTLCPLIRSALPPRFIPRSFCLFHFVEQIVASCPHTHANIFLWPVCAMVRGFCLGRRSTLLLFCISNESLRQEVWKRPPTHVRPFFPCAPNAKGRNSTGINKTRPLHRKGEGPEKTLNASFVNLPGLRGRRLRGRGALRCLLFGGNGHSTTDF